MLQTKQEIIHKLEQNRDFLRSHGVKKIGVFGSYSRGFQHSESDIDLLIEFERGKKTFDNFMTLVFFLEDLLEHKVELVTKESLSPHIGPYILKETEYASLAA